MTIKNAFPMEFRPALNTKDLLNHILKMGDMPNNNAQEIGEGSGKEDVKTEPKGINTEVDVQERFEEEKNGSDTAQRKLATKLLRNRYDFSIFEELINDGEKCLNYLSDLKWSKGYRCRQCDNDKYIEGKISNTRKCTVCAKIESATSNTLFHNLKFPIEKAFHLIYLVYINRQCTLDDISSTIHLRRSTCYKFRKKVFKAILERSKGKKLRKEKVSFLILGDYRNI